MKRLIIQNWSKPQKSDADTPAHAEVREALEKLDGVKILDLKSGQGLVEVTGKNAAGDAKLKSTVESTLSETGANWKVYEESSDNYSLPKTFKS